LFKSLPFCLRFQGEELKEAVKSEFFPWLSQYLVMKRVSIEPNFHDLYIKFMETLKWKELFQLVLQETYRNIKVLNIEAFPWRLRHCCPVVVLKMVGM
jgi:hypothetical protein